MSPTDIQIKIFDNSITFFNPGRLYGDLTIEKLKTDRYQSRTRNKLVAEAFYLTCDIEKYGSGFIRVRKEIAEYPTMEFAYEESGDGFLVTVSYREQKVTTTPITTPKTREKIIQLIEQNNGLTREEMAQQLGISINGVKQHIMKQKKDGILKRVGSHRSGIWVIAPHPDDRQTSSQPT